MCRLSPFLVMLFCLFFSACSSQKKEGEFSQLSEKDEDFENWDEDLNQNVDKNASLSNDDEEEDNPPEQTVGNNSYNINELLEVPEQPDSDVIAELENPYHNLQVKREKNVPPMGTHFSLNPLKYIAFDHLKKYTSRLRFYTDRVAKFEVFYRNRKDIVLKIKDSVVDKRLARPLDMSEFDSLIDSMTVNQFSLPTKNVVVYLFMNAQSVVHVVQTGNMITVLVEMDEETRRFLPASKL